MKMKNVTDLYSVTNWRTYLDPTGNKRVEKFLASRGLTVLAGLITTIESAVDQGMEKLVILVHPNVSSLIMVTDVEYEEVLNYCLDYFQTLEEYELCADTLRILKKVRNEKKKKK